ncbi:hypothetical protein V6N11_047338 [Hibiscus sabdariffa]|uniref:Uncharacterized protein n=2 Tax=Hibiscus sabdariffa TaxID=183260 RepID=A0ABR2AR72_9ROSI
MVTCTPSQQGTNRPRKGPNGASSQPVRRAPPPWHKGTMGAVKRVARRVQPRICREGWTVAQQQARVGVCNGSIGPYRSEGRPRLLPAHS